MRIMNRWGKTTKKRLVILSKLSEPPTSILSNPHPYCGCEEFIYIPKKNSIKDSYMPRRAVALTRKYYSRQLYRFYATKRCFKQFKDAYLPKNCTILRGQCYEGIWALTFIYFLQQGLLFTFYLQKLIAFSFFSKIIQEKQQKKFYSHYVQIISNDNKSATRDDIQKGCNDWLQ